MTFVWRTLCAALNPIAIHDVPHALERFLEHLARQSPRRPQRQAVAFYYNIMMADG
jgi:hypothetical protein